MHTLVMSVRCVSTSLAVYLLWVTSTKASSCALFAVVVSCFHRAPRVISGVGDVDDKQASLCGTFTGDSYPNLSSLLSCVTCFF